MFNLEQQISAWRSQMLAAGICQTETLDELESHLREEIEQQFKSGSTAAQAFAVAVERLGNGRRLRREFAKCDIRNSIIAYVAAGFWLAVMALLFVRLNTYSVQNESVPYKLSTLMLVGGLAAVGLSGIFGIFYVTAQCLQIVSIHRREALISGIKILNLIAVGSMALGVLSMKCLDSRFCIVALPHYDALMGLPDGFFALAFRHYSTVAFELFIIFAVALQVRRPGSSLALARTSIAASVLGVLSFAGPFMVWVGSNPQFSFQTYHTEILTLYFFLAFLCISFLPRMQILTRKFTSRGPSHV